MQNFRIVALQTILIFFLLNDGIGKQQTSLSKGSEMTLLVFFACNTNLKSQGISKE